MKHISSYLLLASVLIAAACKDYSETNHMEQMAQMKDSIFKAYPTVAAIHTEVRDRNLYIITLGSRQLYKTDDTRRHKMATDLGRMTLRIFGDTTDIEKQKLIITANERNQDAEPKDGLSTEISIDSLKKAPK